MNLYEVLSLKNLSPQRAYELSAYFKHLTIPTSILIYKTMVKYDIDYCCSVWAPYKKGDRESTEKATKILPALPYLITYPEFLIV